MHFLGSKPVSSKAYCSNDDISEFVPSSSDPNTCVTASDMPKCCTTWLAKACGFEVVINKPTSAVTNVSNISKTPS